MEKIKTLKDLIEVADELEDFIKARFTFNNDKDKDVYSLTGEILANQLYNERYDDWMSLKELVNSLYEPITIKECEE